MNAFDRLPPFGLVYDFLGSQAVGQLLTDVQSRLDTFRDSTIGYGEGLKIDKTRRCSCVLREIGDFCGQVEYRMRELMPTMVERLGGAQFTPYRFEMEMAAHGDGAFFARHTDLHPDPESVRVISCVYYFHELPRAFSGGVLRLHSLAASGQQGTFVDVEPHCDMLVFFHSWFPHEVLPISCPSGRFIDSRFAINCWIHRGIS